MTFDINSIVNDIARPHEKAIADGFKTARSNLDSTIERIKLIYDLQTGEHPEVVSDQARRLWWKHCEKITEGSIPSFRQFWNDDATFKFVE